MAEPTEPAAPAADCEAELDAERARAERLRRVTAAAEEGDEREMLRALDGLEPDDTVPRES